MSLLERPDELSPELKWCTLHGGWDPRSGAKMCAGCAYTVAVEETKGRLYSMHPTDARRFVERVTMRGPVR